MDNAARLMSAYGDDLIHVGGKGWGVWDGGRFSFRSGDLRAFEVGQQLGALVEAEARAWFDAEIDDVTAQRRLNEELEKRAGPSGR